DGFRRRSLMSHPSNLPERDVTPEKALRSRRRLLTTLGVAGLGLAAGGFASWRWLWPGSLSAVLGGGRVQLPGADAFPARLNPRFANAGRPLTDELEAARYCNFYEFTSTKAVWRHTAAFRPVPWAVEVCGLVARPRTFDLDDLLRTF